MFLPFIIFRMFLELLIARVENYYPFGMLVPNRHKALESIVMGSRDRKKTMRLEVVKEIRLIIPLVCIDSRIGRFLSRDPLASSFPWNSAYSFSENRVMDMVELEGGEIKPSESNSTNIDGTIPNAFV
jgi:hypothetical protein